MSVEEDILFHSECPTVKKIGMNLIYESIIGLETSVEPATYKTVNRHSVRSVSYTALQIV
jgi:hypothetical protein